MRRISAVVVSLAVLTIPTLTVGHAADEQQPTATAPTPSKPYVVRKVVHRPKAHKTIVKRFTPWGTPTSAQAHAIASAEASRFGCSLATLSYRIGHESGWYWNASNGQYRGILQYAYSTFTRGLSTMPRGVRLVSRSTRTRRSQVVRVYSDGHVTRGRGARRSVHVLRILKGTMPRWPAHTHAWAQIRIGCQALAGQSAVHASEWPARY